MLRGRDKRRRISDRSSGPNTKTTTKKQKKEKEQNFAHLEYGEETLQASISRLSLASYREVLFQVIYALHVAGESFAFSHYDLHERNILLRTKPKGKDYCIIYFQGCAHYITGRMVKIIDFGLSRLTTEEGQVLYNTRDSVRELFSPAADLQSIASWRWRKTAQDLAGDVALFYDLRKQLRKGIPTAKLLTHPSSCLCNRAQLVLKILLVQSSSLLRAQRPFLPTSYLTPYIQLLKGNNEKKMNKR
jgi:serine/threonine protein kinase